MQWPTPRRHGQDPIDSGNIRRRAAATPRVMIEQGTIIEDLPAVSVGTARVLLLAADPSRRVVRVRVLTAGAVAVGGKTVTADSAVSVPAGLGWQESDAAGAELWAVAAAEGERIAVQVIR